MNDVRKFTVVDSESVSRIEFDLRDCHEDNLEIAFEVPIRPKRPILTELSLNNINDVVVSDHIPVSVDRLNLTNVGSLKHTPKTLVYTSDNTYIVNLPSPIKTLRVSEYNKPNIDVFGKLPLLQVEACERIHLYDPITKLIVIPTKPLGEVISNFPEKLDSLDISVHDLEKFRQFKEVRHVTLRDIHLTWGDKEINLTSFRNLCSVECPNYLLGKLVIPESAKYINGLSKKSRL